MLPDSASLPVPGKDPNQIEQGAFNVPFDDDSSGNDNGMGSGQWTMIGMGVLLFLLVFSGRKKAVAK
ncbi:MAG: hypothetical protein IPO83_09750 [Chitinophagaceae bacterium]|nr:hypothetical protein [Chitinophagaceae bacterium]